MTWDEILTLGGWDTLVEKMVEENCYEFGIMSLEKRIIMLIEKYGLSDWTKANICAQLIFSEYLRHIIVHNGGRANQEFINKTKRINIGIGDIVPIMEEDLLVVMPSMQLFISDLFRAIATKFFKRDGSEIKGLCIYSSSVKS
jgi:hypothetical protein